MSRSLHPNCSRRAACFALLVSPISALPQRHSIVEARATSAFALPFLVHSIVPGDPLCTTLQGERLFLRWNGHIVGTLPQTYSGRAATVDSLFSSPDRRVLLHVRLSPPQHADV